MSVFHISLIAQVVQNSTKRISYIHFSYPAGLFTESAQGKSFKANACLTQKKNHVYVFQIVFINGVGGRGARRLLGN